MHRLGRWMMAQWDVAKKTFFEKWAAKKGANSQTAEKCLTMTLKHGDYVVMHGCDIQKYFEVNPPSPISIIFFHISMISHFTHITKPIS